ncbi:TPR-like protein [Microthyrium microscopicum]|uniref:TPR-like protein n=1 Tax=Microthyrium microscopicum TaxID=703497 RepID=A0A6A6U494_9PEZI|nr:TPR-like protein [Microthyrium microscopicum]
MAPAPLRNGSVNGIAAYSHTLRFSHVPPSIDIPVEGGEDQEAVELDLTELESDPTEMCTLLENENVAKNYWMTIALAYAKQGDVDRAIEILNKGLIARRNANMYTGGDDRLGFLNALCWMWLFKVREAPRLVPEGSSSGVHTKEYYINQATSTLNEASRVSPSYPPLFLARGVLSLLRASTLVSSKPTTGAKNDMSERTEALRQAQKCFQDAMRLSDGKNIMAMMGTARVFFSMGRFVDALSTYQRILERAPQLSDPDPRIGIGCCLWQLGHRDDAKNAWERALQVNANSKQANTLLGIYYLQLSSKFPTSDPAFASNYKMAMQQYTQKAYKLDQKLPLACATFGSYFLTRQTLHTVEKLARAAIEYTDVNAIASDGWYLLARKEHQQGNLKKAKEYYTKADQARAGNDKEKGYLPARFGVAQIDVIEEKLSQVKYDLDKMAQTNKSVEVLTLLGTLYAEQVFSEKLTASNKDDIAQWRKKAITLLESVRNQWKDKKDSKSQSSADASVLINLARLYELDHPEKSLQALKQVEQIEIDAIPEEEYPEGLEGDAQTLALQEMIPPPLLNNEGCFHFQAEKYQEARHYFQTALTACVKVGTKDDDDEPVDTDAFVTTISYNLGRTYEAEGNLEKAQEVYEGLLSRHPNYVDAQVRLAFISYQLDPEAGAKEMQALFESEGDNLNVRVIYGWFLNRTKKRTADFAADAEQRLNKHTLLNFDRTDPYLLTSMGNICLSIAREMRGEKEKDRRGKTYDKAFEFFDFALKADPYNAYAAQGLAIVVIEHRRDLTGALQILGNVRETMRDATVYMNLGHVFHELRQFTRAIESYEAALAKKERVSEITILTALGRVWHTKGRTEKSLVAMNQSLEYSRRVLVLEPNSPHYQFNVAFVQFQIAQIICSLPATQRTLEAVELAATDLASAIDAFVTVAKHAYPPYPRSDLEQRANMGRTVAKQLERALDEQRKHHAASHDKLAAAKALREAELQKRIDAQKAREAEAEARRARVLAERAELEEQDRKLREEAIKRREEERAKDEEAWTTDSQGERKKRARVKRAPAEKGGKRRSKKRNSEDVVSDGHLSEGEGGAPRKSKKRRLERGNKRAEPKGKYKSSDKIIDSDEEAGPDEEMAEGTAGEGTGGESSAVATPAGAGDSDADEGVVVQPKQRGKRNVVEDDDDDEDEDEGAENGDGDVQMAENSE